MSQPAAGVVVSCGSCGSRLRVREDAHGKVGKCPKCGVKFQIALPSAPPAKKEAAPPQPVTQLQAAEALSPLPVLRERPGEGWKRETTIARADGVADEPSPQISPGVAGEGEQSEPVEELSKVDWERGMSPEVMQEIEAERARLGRQGTISVAVLVFASLVAGAAVCSEVARFGGAEHWVMKRSVAAWLVGMMTAGAMLASSRPRCGALRFLAAVTAAAAVVLGKMFFAPIAPYPPIDLLFVVMAIAGSTFTFILAEPAKKKAAPRSDFASAAGAVKTSAAHDGTL